MAKDLLFVGGGHAHLTALVNLKDYTSKGHRVTLINPAERHYYSGMGPGALSGIYGPQEIRFNVKKLAEDRGARFVKGRVTHVDPEGQSVKLADGSEVKYDVVSFNTGSLVPTDLVKGSMDRVFPVKPIVNLFRARRTMLAAISSGKLRLVVIGGGAAGLELSGNIERMVRDANGTAEITLVAGSRLLPNFPDKARKIALESLKRRSVRVLEGVRADRVEDREVFLSDGSSVQYDFVFPSVGVRSYPIFKDSGLPVAQDGALLVTNRLNSISYPNIFGGGDCVALDGRRVDRVGVYAVRQNPVLHKNLMVALDGGEFESFEPQDVYMLIFNLGDGTGLFVRKSWVWSGRLAFRLKDYIDRKFMEKFQISGEKQDRTDYPEG